MALKICTIGCGNHSVKVHGPSYVKYKKERPDTVLAACCDLDADRAKQYQAQFGFERAYTDMTEMLHAEKPDAVCVLVPAPLIYQTSIAVMELGYSIMLEKPPGLCKAETKHMIAVAQKTGVINQVAFNRRYIPLIKKLKEEVQLHAKDRVQTLFYEFYRVNRCELTFETTAIHGIDAAKYVIGSDYKDVRITYQEMPKLGPNVANILLDCRFENGVMARLNFCPTTGVILERMSVLAKDHTFFLSTPIWDGFDTPGEYQHLEAGRLVSRLSGNELVDTQEMFVTNGFYDENFSFFENVRMGRACENDLASTLQSVEIAEAIKSRASDWKA